MNGTLLATLVIIATFSCSSSDDSARALTAREFSDLFTDALCGIGERCCQDLGFKPAPGCDDPGFADEVYEKLFANDVRNGARMDDARAKACLAQMHASRTCESSTIPVCDEVFVPTRAEGDPCWSNSHCVAPPDAKVECEWPSHFFEGNPSPGTCKVYRLTEKLGAECGGAKAQCLQGLICMSGTCETMFAVGDPCTDTPFRCPDATYCEGVCIPWGLEGDSCAIDTCTYGLRCDAQTSTCRAGKKTGEPCANDQECDSSECISGRCVPELAGLCLPG